MFHKSKTDVERQNLFNAYLLSILKEKEVIKKYKKIIEEKDFSNDPNINEDKMKGAFNSYVDSLVIKNFLIEQIYTRLKINKTMALNFVNKLDGNQVLILSKVIHEFMKDIQDKYVSNNDYLLKTCFDELQGTYNVLQQQEKIVKS
jgi:predicted transcriptional regulator